MISALSIRFARIIGETAIADMWHNHYETLLNRNANSHLKEDILKYFMSISSHVGMHYLGSFANS